MKESLKKVFTCDFCNKKYFVKNACETHELWCHKNPENFKPCMNECKHLENAKTEIYIDTYHGESSFMANCFRCKKSGQLMYSLSAERRGLVERFELEAHDQVAMPRECADFEEEDYGLRI